MRGLRVSSNELRENSRDAMHRRRCIASQLRCRLTTHNSQLKTRLGVTLIELLITITIIAILAATFLGVSNAAMESSRRARTQTLVNKIHGLLMEKWNEYQIRRVDIDTSSVVNDGYGIEASDRKSRGIVMAFARLDAVRFLMKQEMPDRWGDIIHEDTVQFDLIARRPPGTSTAPAPIRSAKDDCNPDIRRITGQQPAAANLYQMWLPYPAVANSYLRRYNSLVNDVELVRRNQGAECLYMLVMLTCGDGEARTLFSAQDIGDTDNDGAPEFLDGWGRPIQFIRWPAGFAESGRSSLLTADAEADHDPLDPFRLQNPPESMGPTQNRGYRLLPLIFSSGPDGIADIFMADGAVVLNPYAEYEWEGVRGKLGVPYDINNDGEDNSLDNIHNHLLDNR